MRAKTHADTCKNHNKQLKLEFTSISPTLFIVAYLHFLFDVVRVNLTTTTCIIDLTVVAIKVFPKYFTDSFVHTNQSPLVLVQLTNHKEAGNYQKLSKQEVSNKWSIDSIELVCVS